MRGRFTSCAHRQPAKKNTKISETGNRLARVIIDVQNMQTQINFDKRGRHRDESRSHWAEVYLRLANAASANHDVRLRRNLGVKHPLVQTRKAVRVATTPTVPLESRLLLTFYMSLTMIHIERQ